MRGLLALLVLLAGPAAGEADGPLPWLYDVAGVGAGDRLNVREAPADGSPVVGSLARDASGIEVIARDPSERWGQINSGERPGWVALRYLSPQPATRSAGLPPGLGCFGTEPFWSLRPGAGAVVFATPDGGNETLPLVATPGTGIAGDRRRALIARDRERRLTAAIVPGLCSDNMSDRLYGLVASVVVEGSGSPKLLTGCCSIAFSPAD